MAFTHLLALSAPLAVHADTVSDELGQRFTLDGTRLIFDGAVEREEGSRSIDHEDAHELRTFLFEHPEIELLEIQSGGGQVTAALDMAAVLVDFEIDTVVTGRCDSACALVFVAGANRTFEKGGRLGFHSASWSRENIKHYYETRREARGWADEFTFASWVYEEAIRDFNKYLEYMISRVTGRLRSFDELRVASGDQEQAADAHRDSGTGQGAGVVIGGADAAHRG